MDSVEIGVCVGSFVAHHCLFRALYARRPSGDGKTQPSSSEVSDDTQKLYSCYLSHIHCAVTIVSCLGYWCSRPVDVLSPTFMVEVRIRRLIFCCLLSTTSIARTVF